MNPIPIDPQDIIISAAMFMPVIFGLIEFLKTVLKLSGEIVTIMSFVVGFIVEGIVIVSMLLPEPWNLIPIAIIACLTIGLAASGYYKFVNARTTKREEEE